MEYVDDAGPGPENAGERIPMADADVVLFRKLLDGSEAGALYHRLRREVAWKSEAIRLFGKRIAMPRLVAWYGDLPYTYSGLTI